MNFKGVVFTNLDRSTHRRYFMEASLNGMGFPLSNIFRFRSHDFEDYNSLDDLCNAAVNDGFFCFEKLRNSWMNVRDAACQWTWFGAVRWVAQNLDDEDCMLYIQDDVLVRSRWHMFGDLVGPVSDLSIIQLFRWDVIQNAAEEYGVDSNEYARICKRCPPRRPVLASLTPSLYDGFHGAGDIALIFSKKGALQALEWLNENPEEYLEMLLAFRMNEDIEGCYSIIQPWDWIGTFDEELDGSYRLGTSTKNPIYME